MITRRPKPQRRREHESLRRELGARARKKGSLNLDPEDTRKSVARLVLTLVDFLRKVLEKQAIRRMDAGTLTNTEIENVGLALMRLEATVLELAQEFGLRAEDLTLDLGPLGRLS